MVMQCEGEMINEDAHGVNGERGEEMINNVPCGEDAERLDTPTQSSSSPQSTGTASSSANGTDDGKLARPTSMAVPHAGHAKVPPPLGPFQLNTDGSCDIPQSPLDIPLLTPAVQFTPACIRQFFFDPSLIQGSQLSPLSPLTPITPVYTWEDPRQRHSSQSSTLSGYSIKQANSYDPYSGRYRHAPTPYTVQQTNLPQQPAVYGARNDEAPAPSIKQTWYRTFDELFAQFHEPWMLRQIDKDEDQPSDPGWASEEYWAKVRFICETSTCPNQWTSMRGVIRFWYTTALRPYMTSEGQTLMIRQLLFRSFGQKCAKCSNPKFQLPLWYEREVKKVLTKVHEHIVRNLYHALPMYSNGVFYGPRVRYTHIESQKGQPTAEHKSKLCQGCANNTCTLSPAFRSRARSFKQRDLAQIPEHTERQTPNPTELADGVNALAVTE